MTKRLMDTGEMLGLQGLREGLTVLDANAQISQVNDAFCGSLGVAREQLVGRAFVDLVPSEEASAVATHLGAALKKGFGAVRCPLRKYDGSLGRFHLSVSLVRGESEPMLIVTCREIGGSLGGDALSPGAEWLSAALGAAHMGIWEWRNGQSGIIWHELEPVLGLEPGEFDGSLDACFALVHTQDRDRVESQLREAKSDPDRQNVRIQLRLRSPDPEPRWLEITGRLLRDERGVVERMVGTATDVTEARRAQQALEDSESDYRLLAEHSTDMISRHSPAGVYLYASPACRRLLGYEPAELVGRSAYDFFHPDDLAAIEENHRGILEQEQVSVIAYRIRRKDGAYVWFESTSKSILDPETGEVQSIIAASRDVSSRKLVEAALIESEQRYRSLVDALDEGVTLLDRDARIVMSNPSAERILGLTADQLYGRTPLDPGWHLMRDDMTRYGDDELPAIRTLRTGVTLTGVPLGVQRDGGEVKWLSVNAAPLFREGETEPYAVVTSFTDVTERRRVQQALSQLARRVQVESNESFFRVLVSQLAEALETESAFIGLVVEQDPRQVEILAMVGSNALEEGATYDLGGTPCERVIEDRETLVCARQVAAAFPEDDYLRELNLESYAGTPLVDSRQRVVGVLSVLHSRPLSNPVLAGSLLEIFGARASAELERRRVERERQELLHELRLAATAFESHEGMFITDAAHVILRVNQAFTELTGYSPEDVVGCSAEILHSDRHTEAFYRSMWKRPRERGIWQGEVFNRCRDGRVLPMWQSITAVYDDAGEITHFVMFFKDITERKEAEAHIEHLAYHDALTNLPNRALLLDRVQQALARAQRHERYGALLFLDLDNFKTVNDSLGHRTGDLVLVEVAKRLRAAVRDEDTVARLGGDEFVILLGELAGDEEMAAHEAQAVGDKLCEALSGEFRVEDHALRLSGSIGMVLFPGDADSADDLLRHADIAMYQAKAAGRGTTRFFLPEMQAAATERLLVEGELQRALSGDELVLYYQPQIAVGSGRVVGAEALLRWRHPTRGLLLPASFIGVLEEGPLVLPAGQWVLDAACRDVKGMGTALSSLNRFPPVTINVSPRQFWQPDFVYQIEAAIDQAGIAPESIALEVTERVVIQDVADTASKMDRLKRIGVRFSIDDFGTGYSSLSYIKRLPLDVVKIDRSFVKDCTEDVNDRAIVRAIVAMAHSLDLFVIAEGVETEEQLQFLTEQGCDAYQGFLFSPAVPVGEFRDLVEPGKAASP